MGYVKIPLQCICIFVNLFSEHYLFLFRFAVATKYAKIFWSTNSVVTYYYKDVDTHNAMDMGTGIFTAPISGVYGFTFTAQFDCGYGTHEMHIQKME